MNTGKFLTIPADEYHAASRSGQYMSSHRKASRRSEAKTDFWRTSANPLNSIAARPAAKSPRPKAPRWRLDAPHTASSWRGAPYSTSSSSSPTAP